MATSFVSTPPRDTSLGVTGEGQKTPRAESAKGLDPLAMRPSPGSRSARERAFVLSASPGRRGDLLPLRGKKIQDRVRRVKI